MTKWVALLLLLLSKPVTAGESLDVKDWLSRPGVKMLAVEFYASWCGPCKAAVPRWKELHEKYRDKGLRLVVVLSLGRRGCRLCTATAGRTLVDV